MNILSLKHAQVAFLASAQPQRWTRYAPPAGTRTLHDFGDGPEPAVPVDERVVTNEIVKCVDNNFPMDTAAVTNEIVNTVDNNFPMDSPSVTNEIVSAIDNNFPLDIASVGGEFANIVENTSPRDDVSTTQVIVNCLENPPVTYTALNYAYLRSVNSPSGYSPYMIELPNPFPSSRRMQIRCTATYYNGTQSQMGTGGWSSFGNPDESAYTSRRLCGLSANGVIKPDTFQDLILTPRNGWSNMPMVQDPEHPDDPDAKIRYQIKNAIAPGHSYVLTLEGSSYHIDNGNNIWSGPFESGSVNEFTVNRLYPMGTPVYIGNVYGGDYYLHNRLFEYARAWDGDSLLVDIVPAIRHNDDKIGLWDRVSQTFWPFMDGNFVASDLRPDQGEL